MGPGKLHRKSFSVTFRPRVRPLSETTTAGAEWSFPARTRLGEVRTRLPRPDQTQQRPQPLCPNRLDVRRLFAVSHGFPSRRYGWPATTPSRR